MTRKELVGSRFALPGAALLVTALLVAGCGGDGDDAGSASEADIVAVERADLDIQVEAAGLVEPLRAVDVKSKATGEILAIHVETGDQVAPGTLLAQIDPRDVRNALAQAEADLAAARARLRNAEVQHRRAQELREGQVITEEEYETALLEETNAQAAVVKARTNADLAREKAGDVTIRAPIAGTILSKEVEIGDVVASASSNVSGGTTLFVMAELDTVQVRALVDEVDIGQVAPGQVAQVTVEAYPGRPFSGRVYKVEPQAVVEQNVTMFPVLVRIMNEERLLKPGMNAEVIVEIARRQDAVVVPNAAVVSPREVVAAAATLGIDEEAVRESMGGFGPGGRGGAASSGRRERAEAAPGGPDAGSPAASEATPGAPTREECQALRERIQSGGGPPAETDRALLRRCREAFAGGAGSGAAGGAGAGSSPARALGRSTPGVVFVAGENGPEPRFVQLGLSDWESTEVVSGVEPGERVHLISVARLKQQQEEFTQRIRQRTGTGLPGSGGGQPPQPQQQRSSRSP